MESLELSLISCHLEKKREIWQEASNLLGWGGTEGLGGGHGEIVKVGSDEVLYLGPEAHLLHQPRALFVAIPAVLCYVKGVGGGVC